MGNGAGVVSGLGHMMNSLMVAQHSAHLHIAPKLTLIYMQHLSDRTVL